MPHPFREALSAVLRDHEQKDAKGGRRLPGSILQRLDRCRFTLGGEPLFPARLIETEQKKVLILTDRRTGEAPSPHELEGRIIFAHLRAATPGEIRRDLGEKRCDVNAIEILEPLSAVNGALHFGPTKVSRAYPVLAG